MRTASGSLAQGIRFRLSSKAPAGRPDLVFKGAPSPALSLVTYRRRATTVGRYGNPDSDQRGEIGHRTSRSNSRALKTGHRACSHNPRKRPFRLDPLILNGLTQSDDFRTRSGRNGEYVRISVKVATCFGFKVATLRSAATLVGLGWVSGFFPSRVS